MNSYLYKCIWMKANTMASAVFELNMPISLCMLIIATLCALPKSNQIKVQINFLTNWRVIPITSIFSWIFNFCKIVLYKLKLFFSLSWNKKHVNFKYGLYKEINTLQLLSHKFHFSNKSQSSLDLIKLLDCSIWNYQFCFKLKHFILFLFLIDILFFILNYIIDWLYNKCFISLFYLSYIFMQIWKNVSTQELYIFHLYQLKLCHNILEDSNNTNSVFKDNAIHKWS